VSRPGRLAGLAAASLALALGLTGCSGLPQHDVAYTFHTAESGIKVNTPELRMIKASADIAPCPKVGSPSSPVKNGLPALTLPCLGGGRNVDLAGLRGPLLLNFWAQYCGPCQQESPLLQKLASASHGSVKVLGVDFIDPRPAAALGFAKSHGLTYPQIADPAEAAKGPLRISGLPYTFFVDAEGAITYTQIGPIQSTTQLVSLLREHLGVAVPGLAGS
jgi:cytochrome c biogenesis protein CcmG, thiol:disulfide interchange protein DsbE